VNSVGGIRLFRPYNAYTGIVELASTPTGGHRLAVNDRNCAIDVMQPKTAFSCFLPVHRADLEGRLRVDLTHPRLEAATGDLFRKRLARGGNYDFDWMVLRNQKDRIEKINFDANSVLGSPC
jgi:hypothetical protein